jgi:hypothetical protein
LLKEVITGMNLYEERISHCRALIRPLLNRRRTQDY